MKSKRPISKRRVQQYLDELIALAKTVNPDVQAVSNIPGDEEQHARLKIYVPDEFEEKIGELISDRVYDIFVNEGYNIAAVVYEKSQLFAA